MLKAFLNFLFTEESWKEISMKNTKQHNTDINKKRFFRSNSAY